MTSENPIKLQDWNPERYETQHSFVWQYGAALLDLLAPQPGEQILDLGCGTGQLTDAIAQTGANVRGIDADEAMVTTARQRYPDICFQVADARKFRVSEPVDGIFSNAVLHWVTPPEQAIDAMVRALKPGGKLVVEFGGKGNVQQIVTAVETVRQQRHLSPWYFPSIGEYSQLLEGHGLEVVFATLIDRPTPLNEGEQGLANWLKMFGGELMAGLDAPGQVSVLRDVETHLRPQLYDGKQWHADYRRLRIVATKIG